MVKVISLSNEAYGRLKAMKGEKSFSEIVIEIINNKKVKKKSLADFFGVWKDNSAFWEKMEKKIQKDRKKAKLREVQF